MAKKITFANVLDLDHQLQEEMRLWRNQDFVRFKMFYSHVISEEEHQNFLQRLATNSDRKIFIGFLDDQPFGVLNCDYFSDKKDLEFGFYLIDPDQVNSGLGIVMEYVLLNYAFHQQKVCRVFCRTLSRNKKVVSLHTKFGFDIEEYGQMKDEEYTLQAITPEMWQESKPQIEKLLKYIVPSEEIGQLR